MRSSPLVSLALTFLLSLASAVHSTQEVEIFAWPLASDKPQPLATVVYTATNASIKSYTPPTLPPSSPTDNDIIRIGFYHPSGHYSAIATAASNLATSKSKKTLQLHVRPDGTLYHLGFKPGSEPVSQGQGGKETIRDWNVEVVMLQAGPKVALNQPVVVSADGEVEEKEVEKSFLQKYWWAIGLFLVVQVVMGGSKE